MLDCAWRSLSDWVCRWERLLGLSAPSSPARASRRESTRKPLPEGAKCGLWGGLATKAPESLPCELKCEDSLLPD